MILAFYPKTILACCGIATAAFGGIQIYHGIKKAEIPQEKKLNIAAGSGLLLTSGYVFCHIGLHESINSSLFHPVTDRFLPLSSLAKLGLSLFASMSSFYITGSLVRGAGGELQKGVKRVISRFSKHPLAKETTTSDETPLIKTEKGEKNIENQSEDNEYQFNPAAFGFGIVGGSLTAIASLYPLYYMFKNLEHIMSFF